MAIGHPIYFDSDEQELESIYPVINQRTNEASWHKTEIQNLPLQPNAYWDNRLSAPNFMVAFLSGEQDESHGYAHFLQERVFYPEANTHFYLAPAEPIRYDYYQQLAQAARTKGKQASGEAPYQGVYTGYQGAGVNSIERYTGPGLDEIGGEYAPYDERRNDNSYAY
jgi:hypothetical protein